ncbi:hypothetical protein BGZ99_002700 [Dissophora globulifera]|uniref:Bromo domain-containing protein n=1 Tax=Dissophora globulifera TaxID=979702 RepID=A0A9P6RNC3_9FUNG|nr:hypothetical protein BGZ99_002700 [Dissophora globulifera]
MGSTSSPSSSSLDPHQTSYTHAQHKRKSTSQSSQEDLHHYADTAATTKKKKKRSKRERREDEEDDDHYSRDTNRHRNGHDVAPSAQHPVQKLPTIKISLRLPSNPSIVTASTSTNYPNGGTSISTSKKNWRPSEQISIVSEDEDQDSEDEHDVRSPSLHKKKKKHKHRHRHKHSKHKGQDSEQLEVEPAPEPEPERSATAETPPATRDDAQVKQEDGGITPVDTTPQPDSEEPKREGSTPMIREGSAPAVIKTVRKGKALKRLTTPRLTAPDPPKKKELSVVCYKLLDNFVKRDAYVLFTQPVDVTLVPDYSTVIKNPMDFSTMRAKVDRNFYPNIDEFLKDFQLVCDNARLYNSKETLYWRQADKLWDWGSRAIERERHSILDKEEEMLKTVKDEETLDVGGMGDYNNHSSTNSSRPHLLSMDSVIDSPISAADPGRSHTPQQYRKTRKIKHRRDGTIAFTYSTDGSIDPASHPDPWSLVPVVQDFGSAPLVCPLVESTPNYNGLYLDDYPYWKAPNTAFRPAVYQDYGPYAILGKPAPDGSSASGVQNIPAYTGMVFGDEKGEAYVRSLAMFLDGIVDESELATARKDDIAGLLEVQDYVRRKVEALTRGASTIVDKVATVIREESTGQSSSTDTRVPMELWHQEFQKQESDQSSSESAVATMNESNQDLNNQSNESAPIDLDDVEMTESGSESLAEVGHDAAPVVSKDGSTSIKDEQKVAGEPVPAVWIDIRQVVNEIRAWPKILRERGDYEAWRLLKIELASLLPSSARTTPSTPAAAPAAGENDVDIRWGQTWTGGNTEESKKWVREFLEQNSVDMQEIARLLATKVADFPTSSSSIPGSPSLSSTLMKSSTVSSSAPSITEEQEKALVEGLVKNIRKRLAEMVQYVPLSEINPQRLPPPTPSSASSVPSTSSSPAPAPSTVPDTTSSLTPTATESSARAASEISVPAAPATVTAPLASTDDSATSAQTTATPSTDAPADRAASADSTDSGTPSPAAATQPTRAVLTEMSTPNSPSDGSLSSLSSPGSTSSP